MTNTALSAYPWLCSTIKKPSYSCYNEDNGSMVSKNEGYNAEALTTEAYGTYGLKMVYYKVSEHLKRDKIYGEDQLQVVERAFNTIMYTEQIPPNVRTYQIQGIWGEDVVTCRIGVTAFKYWSTYGGYDRNKPLVYPDFMPRIGDIVYMEANDTFYEIRDVKYYQEAFGLTSHTYTLTLKVYKDTKLTIDNKNPTISSHSDPIYGVATWDFPEQYETNDILKKNDILTYEELVASKNVNHMDVLYNPNKDYNLLEELNDNIEQHFDDYSHRFTEMYISATDIKNETVGLKDYVHNIKETAEKNFEQVKTDISNTDKEIKDLDLDIEIINYKDTTK